MLINLNNPYFIYNLPDEPYTKMNRKHYLNVCLKIKTYKGYVYYYRNIYIRIIIIK